MELESRAKFFARVMNVLYLKQGLRGKLIKASRGARYVSLGVRLADPLKLDTALKLAQPLAVATNTRNVVAQILGDTPGLVTYQFELPEGYWDSYTRGDVTGLGVGLGENRKQVDFTFNIPHTLVAGQTQIAGKTETVKSILTGLFMTYQPNELSTVICDPHRDYAAFNNVAHLACPIAFDLRDIDHAIDFAYEEFKVRRSSNARNANHFVVVIDEGEDELEDKERLAKVQTIGKQAAKFQMNLIVSTQKPNVEKLGDLFNNLGNRFIGKVSDAPISARLTGHAGLNCHQLTGKGDFIHIGETIERFQVAQATEDDIAKIARKDGVHFEENEEAEEENRPGAKPKPLDAKALAHYIWFGVDNVTINQASELGLGRRRHYTHREFAREIMQELGKLRDE